MRRNEKENEDTHLVGDALREARMRARLGKEPEYVSFWPRVWAMIIDGLVMALIMYLIMYLGWVRPATALRGEFLLRNFIDHSIVVFVDFVYTMSFWMAFQATPGKMVFGAKIIDAGTLGKPSLLQFLSRYIGYFLSGFPSFRDHTFGQGYLQVMSDEKCRARHDMLAGTLVVYK
ncbi:MAG: RDD family protein [Zoogloeaceae bacterium]|nr:RDD family protein [Zoogloeaceae bacterium]